MLWTSSWLNVSSLLDSKNRFFLPPDSAASEAVLTTVALSAQLTRRISGVRLNPNQCMRVQSTQVDHDPNNQVSPVVSQAWGVARDNQDSTSNHRGYSLNLVILERECADPSTSL